MENLIIELIKSGGPLFGPLLFLLGLALSWFYHSLLYKVSVRQNRFALFLLDKHVATLPELLTYGLIEDLGGSAVDEYYHIRVNKGAA